MPEQSSHRLSVSVGFGLFLFALLVRFIGVGWGLPNERHLFSLHPDEPILLGYSQQVNPLTGDFDPGFYNYPTLYLSLSRIGADFVNAYGGGPVVRPESSTAAVPITTGEMARPLRNYHLVGRWISMLTGAGMVWVMFAWLRKRFGMALSVIGALLIALSPGLVMHSCFQTVDVTAAFFVLLSLFWSYRTWEEADHPMKPALLAGLFAGLSAGTKYTGILALAALLSFIFKPGAVQRAKASFSAVGVALVTFLITTPGCVLNTEQFLHDFQYEMAHTSTGHGLVFAGTPSGFLYHWANLAASTGMLTIILGVFGLLLMGWRAARQNDPESSWSWAVGPLAFFLLTYVLIGRSEVKFLRYVFPLIPVLVLAVIASLDLLSKREKLSWLAPVLGIFAIMGIGGGGLQSTLLNMLAMVGRDPRNTFAEYYATPQTVGVVSDPWYYTPTFYFQSAAPRSVPFETRETFRLECKKPPILRYVPENPDERLDWDPRLITELKPDIIIFSSFEFDDLDRISKLNLPEYEGQVKRFREFMQLLTAEYGADRSLGGLTAPIHDLQYISPKLWVWKRLDRTAPISKSSSTTSPPNAERPSTP